ncbi:glycosyltransferase [Sulfitobacter sp. 916]|uniref:glycosyltransferase n=1 Tax=Sulfitobacter sp. 916 TaxID=3368559 RepID=UPI00374500BE
MDRELFYRDFEEAFRGPREEIIARLDFYAPFARSLRELPQIPQAAFDMGCGRGEWLEALGSWGFTAQGVDLDQGMLSEARDLGLDVTCADALETLSTLPDNSQAIISAFHLVEHIPQDMLLTLLEGSVRALAPGGILIIETPNPEAIGVATLTFHNDATHQSPIPPEVLKFLFGYHGFKPVGRFRLNGPEVVETPGLQDVLYGAAPDYVVIGQKPGDKGATEALSQAFSVKAGASSEDLAQAFDQKQQEHRAELQQQAKELKQQAERITELYDQLNQLRNQTSTMQDDITLLHRLKKTKFMQRSRKLRKLSALIKRKKRVPPLSWQLEGPFDSSYSLALVNRELARALKRAGQRVCLVSAEGPGTFEPDKSFLSEAPDIAAMFGRFRTMLGGYKDADVVTRNMYPPRVDDLPKGSLENPILGGLHCYAWEETGFPVEYVDHFNEHLRFMTVTSAHVQRIMVDNGVCVPAYVVGNGVDHLPLDVELEQVPILPRRIKNAQRVFIHVSSCFPRKGADVLLKAWAAAFGDREDVALIIKTFENPHNDIAAQIASTSGLSQVHLISDDLSAIEMAALIASAHIAVLPSRAEGFGLPVAEALMAGCRVITTGWSGQTIFKGCPLLRFIDYDLVAADSHLGAGDSLWAEPDLPDLVNALNEATEAALPTSAEQQEARDWLLDRFTWDAVAQRSIAAVRHAAANSIASPRIGWISTFNTRCGIATYSEHLLDHMPNDDIIVLAPDSDNTVQPDESLPYPVVRCWSEGQDDLERLTAQINAANPDVLVVQFNYAFFEMSQLGGLLDAQRTAGRRVVVMLHGSNDARAPADRQLRQITSALQGCDRLLVHTLSDMSRLRDMGIEENVTLVPHGILAPVKPEALPARTGPIVLGSYGFFLPGKGLVDLIDVVAILRRRGYDIELRMINAEYPQPISRAEIELAQSRVSDHQIESAVHINTEFTSDTVAMAALQDCDLIVFPYQSSAESASGAVRYGLASGRPVAVTPLEIFSDVADITLTLPGCSVSDMAKGIESWLDDLRSGPGGIPNSAIAEVQKRGADWCAARSYMRTGARLSGMLTALHNTPPTSLFDVGV